MEWIILIFGFFIGSFLNVCIYRIPNEISIIYPPSSCSKCNNKIKYYDLIPIVSYLILRGKCRFCGESVSLRYPVIEFLNGILYFFVYKTYGLHIDTIYYCIITSLLIVITFIDYDHMIIPYRLNISLAVLGLLNIPLAITAIGLKYSIMGGIIGFVIFFVIAFVTGGQMGGGDILLMGSLGIIFGIRGILMITVLSFVTGAIISIVLIVSGLKTRKDHIPFGPFIALSAILVILFETDILYYYYSLII